MVGAFYLPSQMDWDRFMVVVSCYFMGWFRSRSKYFFIVYLEFWFHIVGIFFMFFLILETGIYWLEIYFAI